MEHLISRNEINWNLYSDLLGYDAASWVHIFRRFEETSLLHLKLSTWRRNVTSNIKDILNFIAVKTSGVIYWN
jgi:hypothetical protein